jgi:hypothetical protein
MEVEAEELLRTHGPGAMQVVIDRIVAAVSDSISRRCVSLAEFKRELARLGKSAGPIAMPRNSGTRCTNSKRVLLDGLAKLGATW